MAKTNRVGSGAGYRDDTSSSGLTEWAGLGESAGAGGGPEAGLAPLRVGIIGLGIGQSHIEGYRGHPRARVVAVTDTNPKRLKEVADRFDIPGRFSDAKEMLAKGGLDIVSVCTPNAYHKELTIAALKSGAHVLCEKPMALNATEAREMQTVADTSKKRIMMNFSYRFTDQSQALKAQVDSGALGTIYAGRTVWHRRRGMPGLGGWFGDKSLAGGGPLIDLGVHRLDLALWLMGQPKPVHVLARTFNHLGTARAAKEGQKFSVEDLAMGLMTFADGSCLAVEASWASNIKEAELMETRLLGTKGGLVQRNLNEGYEFEAELYLESHGSHYDMRLHQAEAGTKPAMWHFVEAISKDIPHSPTGHDGAYLMEVLDALYESAATGKPVLCKA